MTLADNRLISYEDLLKLREETDDKVELIDNVVYMTPAPTPMHQKICFIVAKILDGYVSGKSCQMLQGVNVRLYDEQKRKIGDIIPDISVFCQYKDLNFKLYKLVAFGASPALKCAFQSRTGIFKSYPLLVSAPRCRDGEKRHKL